MVTISNDSAGGRRVRRGAAIAGVLAILAALGLWAALPAFQAAPDENGVIVSGPLDGMDFVGLFGPVDDRTPREDTLHFRDGHFWSGICAECGFMPGVYRSRTVGDAIEFQGVLESPERGRFTYEGTVRDGEIDVRVNWRRERWYWTIDRDYRFEGKVAEIGTASLDAARLRAAGETAPTCPS